MSILQAIVLGITQGLSEFAPVSSSGHLILVPWLFNWDIANDPAFNKTFDVALHMGTLIGAVVYFRKDLWRYLVAWFHSIAHRSIRTVDEKLAWALVIGTIPGAVVGATFQDVIEERLGQPALIAVMLAVFGVILYVVDKRAPSRESFEEISVRDGGILGIAQALALQPGVSRSGVTITAARLMGIDRESAARFSFLLSIPIIAGAGLFKGVDLAQDGFPPGTGPAFFWGIVSSAVSGFVVIAFLLAYLRRRTFFIFMVYRIAVAVLVLAVVAIGVR